MTNQSNLFFAVLKSDDDLYALIDGTEEINRAAHNARQIHLDGSIEHNLPNDYPCVVAIARDETGSFQWFSIGPSDVFRFSMISSILLLSLALAYMTVLS